jgi:uncharacterized protein DUF6585
MATDVEQGIPEAAYTLGELKHVFRVSRGALVMHVVAVLLCVLLIGGALYKNSPLRADLGEVVMLVVLFGAVIGGTTYGAIMVARYIRGRHLRVLVFAEGFVCFRDGRTTVCRWDDLDIVHEHFSNQPGGGDAFFRRLTIRNRRGEEWVFDMRRDLLEDFVRLTEIAHDEEGRRHLPLALADLGAGESVNCSAVQLTPDGLVCDGDILPWHLVGKTTCRDLALQLYTHGQARPWKTVSINDVVNPMLILAVIREMSR